VVLDLADAHVDDPAASVRTALRLARTPSPWPAA
jgi:hypothetical protein